MAKFLIIGFIGWVLFDLFVMSPFGAMVRTENPYGKCLKVGYEKCYTDTTKIYLLDYSETGEDKECRPIKFQARKNHDSNYNGCNDIFITLPYRKIDKPCMKRERVKCKKVYWKK